MESQKISAYSELEMTQEMPRTLIIRFVGNADEIAPLFLSFDELLFGFAIVTLSPQMLQTVLTHPQIVYVETPKQFAPQLASGKQESCILPLTRSGLSGAGVICAVIDTGIDYRNPEFIRPDKSSRIVAIYDDATREFYTRKTINSALAGETALPSVASSPHGTYVATIMAGNSGVAYESDLLILKLQNEGDDYSTTTSLMRCFTYAVKTAEALSKPLCINLSYGTNNGSHMGDSLIEQYINMLTTYGQTSIIVGSGNDGAGQHCAQGSLTRVSPNNTVAFSTGQSTGTFYLLVYTLASDSISVSLAPPSTDYEVKTAVSGPSPYSLYREHAFLITQTDRIGGIWTVTLSGAQEPFTDSFYRMYLSVPADFDARFFTPSQQGTFTIPSTAADVISVGAYNAVFDAYAPFSGRGFVSYLDTENGRQPLAVKPELVAPGVSVRLPDGTIVNGTSFAAPFVSGTAALMMQWGIVLGNDPTMYGLTVKSNMIKGARPLRGEPLRPNDRTGYGALCAENSLPI